MESDACVHFLVGMNKQELLCFFFIQNYIWVSSLSLVCGSTGQQTGQTISFNTPAITGETQAFIGNIPARWLLCTLANTCQSSTQVDGREPSRLKKGLEEATNNVARREKIITLLSSPTVNMYPQAGLTQRASLTSLGAGQRHLLTEVDSAFQ